MRRRRKASRRCHWADGTDGRHGARCDKPAPPAGPLKITFGDKSAAWTPATLAALPHKTVTVYNEHTKANETYSGVQLIELLTPLGVPAKPHGKDFRLYLVAEGSDGYEVVYSIGESTPDVHDRHGDRGRQRGRQSRSRTKGR